MRDTIDSINEKAWDRAMKRPHWTEVYTFECDSTQETCTAAELYKRYGVFIRKHRGFSLINVLKGDVFMADDNKRWKRIR